jgi:hypothetical protein
MNLPAIFVEADRPAKLTPKASNANPAAGGRVGSPESGKWHLAVGLFSLAFSLGENKIAGSLNV